MKYLPHLSYKPVSALKITQIKVSKRMRCVM